MNPPQDPGPSTLTPQQARDRELDYLADVIGRLEQSINERTPTDEALRIAIRDGFIAAASDRSVWAVAIDTASSVVQERAKAEAGTWLFGGVKAFFSRVAWVLMIGLGIYLVGGWSALVAFVKNGSIP